MSEIYDRGRICYGVSIFFIQPPDADGESYYYDDVIRQLSRRDRRKKIGWRRPARKR